MLRRKHQLAGHAQPPGRRSTPWPPELHGARAGPTIRNRGRSLSVLGPTLGSALDTMMILRTIRGVTLHTTKRTSCTDGR